ncbi:MAG: hypothetical protein AB7K04_11875 [Pseudorhodoplanes sp.]
MFHRVAYGVFSVVLLVASTGIAGAQTKTPTGNGPFSSDWSKPIGETGGYIYNDPRLRERRNAVNPNGRTPVCPPGRAYSAASGRCQ